MVHIGLAAALAVCLALVAHRIALAVLTRVTRHMPVVQAMVQSVRTSAGFLLPLMALQAVWQAAPDDLRFIDNVRHLNGLAVIASATWLLVSTIRGAASGVIASHPVDVEDNMNARRILTQTRVIARTAMTVVAVIGAATMLMTFPGAKQVGTRALALWAVLSATLAAPVHAMDTAQLIRVTQAAQQASQECLHLMHHDTDEFSECVDARLVKSARQPEVSLGESYLGLVGCLAAARIATQNSHDCALSFLTQVDRLRKTLRVSDETLCPAVAGDCRSRVAQIVALRQSANKAAR